MKKYCIKYNILLKKYFNTILSYLPKLERAGTSSGDTVSLCTSNSFVL